MRRLLLVISAALFSVTAAVGGTADSLSHSNSGSDVLTPMSVLKVFFLLFVVIALVIIALWMLKKISPKIQKGAASGLINVLSTSYIGPKRALLLIEVLDRVLLVGVTEIEIDLITEFTDPDEVARIRAKAGKGASGENFASALSSFFKTKPVLNEPK
ncbi:MAG: flagellar biosynthetic protein FliO [FCB group bacterium]|nr:flagellar biosynthetic protein FliO [FCB group bacterium]